MALTGLQIRMARAALRWSLQDLADKAGIHWATVQRMESDDGIPGASAKSVAKVQAALEAAGCRFRDPDERIGPAVAAPPLRPHTAG